MRLNLKMRFKKIQKQGFTGLPRDHASGRMLILKELLQITFERCNCRTCSNFQWDVIPSHYSKTKKVIF